MSDALDLRADERIGFNGVDRAAAALECRPHHLRQALREGSLRSYALGRRTILLKEDLIAFLRTRNAPKSSRAVRNGGPHANE